ncbi:MAG TPA: ABC transporter ATP-binding protein [Acidimicrobiales bacterium]|nr:ABC transporter ATP-binding protein [Acidimicrobiales bacterium]
MASVAFAAVTMERAGRTALRSLTLDVDDGTICCLVGPSGCGKSTAVRLLAGLEAPTSGEIRIGDRRVNEVPTRDRGLGMVTQASALLPSRPTEDSVGLPLDLRRDIDRDERRFRIDEQALALDLGGVLGRPPSTLSGGEIQVAQIARAVIARPRVLLLDEPLARIDPARRGMVRADLVRLQQLYGVTTIWVTADQRDALAVADRVAVLIDGRLEQAGPPMHVYDRPRTLAVARFFGEPEIGVVRTELDGREVDVGIRPHELRLATPGTTGIRFPAVVVGVELVGRRAIATVTVDGGVLRWDDAPTSTRVGDRIELVVDPSRVHLFDPGTGVAVGHPE